MPRILYNTQSEIQMLYRFKTIAVYRDSQLVRAYRINYDEVDYGNNIYEPQLKSIVQYGSDTVLANNGDVVSGSSLKVAECSYYSMKNNVDSEGRSFYSGWIKPNIRVQGDFDGNGLTDFLDTNDSSDENKAITSPNSGIFSHLSNHDGSFTEVASPLNLDFVSARVRVQGDFSGDGKTDFLVTDSNAQVSLSITNPNTRTYTFLSKGDGTFDKIPFSLGLNWSGALVRVQGDFNGDGRTDFLLTDSNGSTSASINNANTRTFSYLSSGRGTFTKVPFSLGLDFSGALVRVQGDFNGDGLTDFLLTNSNGASSSSIKDPNTRTYSYSTFGNELNDHQFAL